MKQNPKHNSKKRKFRGNRLKINTIYLPVFLWNWLVTHKTEMRRRHNDI